MKKAALKANPEKFLGQFGMLPPLPQTIIKKAEEYLVKVLRPGSEAKNFSGMRAEVFHHTKGSSQQKLPQTSQGLLPESNGGFIMLTTSYMPWM